MLNCVANSKILEEAGFADAFLQPAAGDNGTSLGAALYVHHQILGQPRRAVMATDALGPGYGDDEIEALLRENKLRYEASPDIARTAALRIAAGDVIGWFQGRAEFGPRALGHRSILADPRRRDVKGLLDARIKRREAFRPYAPSVLREAAGDYFTGPGDSPFMLKNHVVRPEKREVIPAVVHVDGSARIQTVDHDTHPLYWQLISELGRATGVPVVLNTSFNGRGETMVLDPQDALRCFFSTGLDALAIGRFLVRK
jgi:carbamoyltransferase